MLAIGWSNGTMEVQFKSGTTYCYAHVSADMVADCLAADSVGEWVQANLVKRPNLHPFRKLGDARGDSGPDPQLARIERMTSALQLVASIRVADDETSGQARETLRRCVEAAKGALL